MNMDEGKRSKGRRWRRRSKGYTREKGRQEGCEEKRQKVKEKEDKVKKRRSMYYGQD